MHLVAAASVSEYSVMRSFRKASILACLDCTFIERKDTYEEIADVRMETSAIETVDVIDTIVF